MTADSFYDPEEARALDAALAALAAMPPGEAAAWLRVNVARDGILHESALRLIDLIERRAARRLH